MKKYAVEQGVDFHKYLSISLIPSFKPLDTRIFLNFDDLAILEQSIEMEQQHQFNVKEVVVFE